MARAIAGGTISFGLVSIPVKLYSATQASAAVSFNLLHEKCGSRLKQQYICPRDNEIVGRNDMVKGYEFSKDQYVTFSTEELKALEEKATQTIDIAEFVPLAKIDPVYFDKAYYLGPEKGGEKAYMLLAQAMRDSGLSALARYAARGKQYLVLLRPTVDEPGGLVMQQLLYADEVRPFSDVVMPDAEVREPELKLAKQLIEQITSQTFDPTQYEDDVRKRIHDDIQRKVDGQDISTAEPTQEPARIIDLMEALKASLGKSDGGGKSKKAPSAAAGAAESEDRRAPRRSTASQAEKAEPKRKSSKR
ncbi:MAG TPA: Ku protein [Polyangia bacterium]|jgi:DNA end-binding protein Ku|nr:Ku protein [Polyangia bacterium]